MTRIVENRYELKYKFDRHLISNLYGWIYSSPALFIKAYSDRVVNSVYFDSENFHSVSQAVNEEATRKKYRVRWYNDKIDSSQLECKAKSGNVCIKSIVRNFGNNQYGSSKVAVGSLLSDVLFYCRKEPLLANQVRLPLSLVSYSREYFVASNPIFEGLRITVDKNISYRRFTNFKLLPYSDHDLGEYLLEVKFPVDSYDLMTTLLKTIEAECVKNSKFMNSLSGIFNK